MVNRIKKIAALAVFLSLAGQFSYAYENNDFQIWNTDSEEVKIYKGVKFAMEQEFRFGENARELYYQHYDWGFVFAFHKMLDLGFFYRLVYEKVKRKWMEEDMPNVNATLKLDLWKFKFEDRNRIEYRHYRFKDDSLRYRNKFALKLPFDFMKMRISPYIADEIFVVSTGVGYNENRFSAGAEFELTKYAKCGLYYMLKENRVKDDKWSWANALGINAKIAF